MNERLRHDIGQLLDAVDELQEVAKAESRALEITESVADSIAVRALREVHCAELNVIQALLARVELFRRRHRASLAAPDPRATSPLEQPAAPIAAKESD